MFTKSFPECLAQGTCSIMLALFPFPFLLETSVSNLWVRLGQEHWSLNQTHWGSNASPDNY